jgi:hypothetical protein
MADRRGSPACMGRARPSGEEKRRGRVRPRRVGTVREETNATGGVAEEVGGGIGAEQVSGGGEGAHSRER